MRCNEVNRFSGEFIDTVADYLNSAIYPSFSRFMPIGIIFIEAFFAFNYKLYRSLKVRNPGGCPLFVFVIVKFRIVLKNFIKKKY